MTKRTCALLAIFLAIFPGVHAQQKTTDWADIEQSISLKKNLLVLQKQVEELRQNKEVQNNPISVGRLYYYQLLIDDLHSEDSSFFKKSAFIDSILNSPAPPELKTIMHLLQAKRLSAFMQKFFYRGNKNLFRNPGGPVYSTMSRDRLDSIIQRHFDVAQRTAVSFNNVDPETLLWLAYDPLMFLFKPTFSDIVFAQKLAYLESQKNTRNYYGIKPDWLLLTPDELIKTTDTIAAFTKDEWNILGNYRQWAAMHKSTDPNAYYFIETLARKFLYNNHQPDSLSDKRYENYLEQLVRSPYTAVKANGVYQLCLLWNKMAGTYNPGNDGYNYNYRWSPQPKFDSAIRFHYVKALKLYEQNAVLLDSFSYMKNILLSMKEQMKQPKANMEINHVHLPGEAIPAMLLYRNVEKLYTRLVRVTQAYALKMEAYKLKETRHQLHLASYSNNNNKTFESPWELIKDLLSSGDFTDKVFDLPKQDDFQNHNCFLKFQGLDMGCYILLYSNSEINTSNQKIDYLELQVSNMAVINNDEKVFVLNRKTGFPLMGASVIVQESGFKKIGDSSIYITKELPVKLVNNDGYVTVNKNADSIKVINGNDTVTTNYHATKYNVPEEVYNDDDYDDMQEYYEDQTKLHLFTDRAIYRPGQTVHFKGIFITRNPKNGEPLVLNWKNLKLPFFKKLFYKLVLKFGKQKLEVFVNDAFGREVDTLSVLPNKFGSVAGSFVIAKTAATGDWEFDTDDIDIDDRNNGRFKVEEYKRPSFEMAIEKPKKALQLTDSFSLKIKLKSFAGALLNNVLVEYTIRRNGAVPYYDTLTGKMLSRSIEVEIENDEDNWGEGYTNDKGELDIQVNDSLLKKYHFSNDKTWTAYYHIEASAIDASGESHEASTNMYLNNRPVRIDIPVATMLDRSELKPLYISTKNEFAGHVKKPVSISIYRLIHTKKTSAETYWPKADVWMYPPQDFEKWFPGTVPETVETKEGKELVYEKSLMAGTDEKLLLPKDLLLPGRYKIEAVSKENGNINGEASREFSVYDKAAAALPEPTSSFHYLPVNSVESGKQLQWLTGNSVQDIFSIYHITWFAKGSKGVKAKYAYNIKTEKKGLNVWNFVMPGDAHGEITITHLYIFNNHLYKDHQLVYTPGTGKDNPEIIVENYRSKLTPGGRETFTVSIKTKNENTAAELMTTMYDASLDKIEKHEWRLPNFDKRMNMKDNWGGSINDKIKGSLYSYPVPDRLMGDYSEGAKALWWLNPLSIQYGTLANFDFENQLKFGFSSSNFELAGRLSGVNITSTAGLEEVVVVGYSSVKRKELTGSVVTIRGAATFSGYNNALYVIDGVVYDGDISKIDPNKLTEIIVLKDAAATAIYGARAANGVVLISTKGPVILPNIPEEPPLVIRKNFNETAFFFPQVHASRDGFYNISFTMPESVTEWKWKMMAHTKNASFSYAEKTIVSQLPLMVQPNMPRFLTQGDKLILKSRISNMDTVNINGTTTCIIEDAETGEDISAAILKTSSNTFSIPAKANGSNAFELNIPPNFLHPLRIKVIAKSAGFSDGEEHVIPILSKKILVNTAVPFVMSKGADTLIKTPDIPADATAYGMGVYITPKPQAAMLNSLPWLAFYAYGCAEQTFNKMLAYSVATRLMRTDTAAQKAMQNIAPKEQKADDALPDELGEETMPWLQLNHAHDVQQQKLRKLLDTLNGHRVIEKYMDDLAGLQNFDGGITWFKGGKSDRYISNYLLGGFGKLEHDSLPFRVNSNVVSKYYYFMPKLLAYCDVEFEKQKERQVYFTDDISFLHARSYWMKSNKPSAALQYKMDSILAALWRRIDHYSLHKQATLIITALRFGKPYSDSAMLQLNSIKQLAITNDGHGTRWKLISNADDLDTQSEETIVRLAEAFEEASQSKETVNGIIQWLLQNKQDHNWSTTKSTAAAIGLLNRQKPVTTGAPVHLSLNFDNQPTTVTDDMFSGKLTAFSAFQNFPASVSIRRSNATTLTRGGLNYYYFTANPPMAEDINTVRISKAIERLNAKTGKWEPITENTVLKIADKLQTTITITAPRQLNYVFIDEKRAAALEPADASSGYEYTRGFSYYRSVRDVGFQFFATSIPSGISSISYQTVVAKEGVFSNGTTALSCMYQPGVRAYCGGMMLKVL
ncbi:MAG: MG2 domain-containing protein [Bacteroidota bacterium]